MLIEVKQFTDYFTREEFISLFVFDHREEAKTSMTAHNKMHLAKVLRYFAYKLADVIMQPEVYWKSKAAYPKDYLKHSINNDSFFQSLITEHKESINLKITLLDETQAEHLGFALVDCVAEFIQAELLLGKNFARAISSYILIFMIEHNDC